MAASDGLLEVEIDGAENDLTQAAIEVRSALGQNATASLTLRGNLADMPPPHARGHHLVVIRRAVGGAVVFSGVSRRKVVSPSSSTFGTLALPCVGHELALGQRIPPANGIAAAKLTTATEQLESLLPGISLSLSNDAPVLDDFRLRTYRDVIAQFEDATGAVFWAEPTAAGASYHMAANDMLAAVAGYEVNHVGQRVQAETDPKDAVATQWVLSGSLTRTRTIQGDGATQEWDLSDVFERLDFLADGAVANAFGGVFADRGLRFREDVEADLTTDLVEFFRSGAEAATTLYIQDAEIAGSAWALDLVRSAAEMRLRANASLLPAADYAVIVRHENSGDIWASADAAVGSGGAPVRDDSADISLPHATFQAGFATDTRVYFISDRTSDRGLASAFNSTTGSSASADSVQFTFPDALWRPMGAAYAGGDDVWVVAPHTGQRPKAFRFSVANGGSSVEDFELSSFGVGGIPNGACTDGTTLWVLDTGRDSLDAYRLSDGARQSGKDIALGSGIWRGCYASDDAIWAADTSSSVRMARAYSVIDQTRLAVLDFSFSDIPADP